MLRSKPTNHMNTGPTLQNTMPDILKWVYPEGASIIDAMLFTRCEQDRNYGTHTEALNSIHKALIPPPIVFPRWYVYMRENYKPFMLSYPMGLNPKQTYNVRIVIDECTEHDKFVKDVYVMTIDIRYNAVFKTNRRFQNLITDRYDNARDFVSLAASAQAAFHKIFGLQSSDPQYVYASDLYESVSDYSSQPTILPAHNSHTSGKKVRS